MISISLCMIVKNEQDTIGNCLESVKHVVDEINIVDTGSTDRTREIVQNYTDRVFAFSWIDDFAAARNFSFQQATKTYILWLDADDVLLPEDQEKLLQLKRTLDPSIDSVTMVYHYAFDEFGNVTYSLRRNRLVKSSNNFRWHGAVHEYLAVGGRILNSDIVVTHKRVHHQSGRNLAIFEKRLARGESFSPRDLYYYANELRDNGHYEKAIHFYQRFLQTDGWVEDKISSCYKLAEMYGNRGEWDQAAYYSIASFELDTPRAELCCQLGYHFLRQNQLHNAVFWYKAATELKRNRESWGFYLEACWTWLPHLQLCVCYYRLGEYEKSYAHNEIARTYRPNDPNILHNKELLEGILQR